MRVLVFTGESPMRFEFTQFVKMSNHIIHAHDIFISIKLLIKLINKMAESIKSGVSRRKYPRELDGAKNEWKALVDHYSEVGHTSDLFENRFDKTKKYLQAESISGSQRQPCWSSRRN
jgi:hypothetical protein